VIKIFVNINEINDERIVATVDISGVVTIKYVVTIESGAMICKYRSKICKYSSNEQLTSTEYFPNAMTLHSTVESMGKSIDYLTRIVAQVIMCDDRYIAEREQENG
jgi:hypothetical protein